MNLSESRRKKNILFFCMAALAVITLVILMFLYSGSITSRDGITLPDEALPAQTPSVQENEDLLSTVTAENVQKAVGSMRRAKRYTQTIRCTLKTDGEPFETTCQLWVRDGVLRAELTSPYEVKHILSDGQTLYLWFDAETRPERITLTEDVTLEDLLGLPTYEDVLKLDASQITEGAFLNMTNEIWPNTLYVCARQDGMPARYWVSLDTGLLCAMELEDAGYRVEQTKVQILSSDDASYAAMLCLPDGSFPFS